MTRDPLQPFRDEVAQALRHALRESGLAEAADDVEAALETPPAEKGDVAYPCFPLARLARKAPQAIAADLADALPPLQRATAAAEGPYLNFRYHADQLTAGTLEAVAQGGDAYGSLPPRGESVIVEHTSANPNGPFHVGRARNPIVGDGVARVLRAAGYDVTTEYYVNDMGKQVALLAWGLQNLGADDVPAVDRDKVDHQKVVHYQAAHERAQEHPDVEAQVNDLLRRFEDGDEEAAKRMGDAAATVLEGMKQSLARLNVTLDNYAHESTYVLGGQVDDVVAALKETSHAEPDDTGAWGIDMEPWGIHGKNTRWVFLRRDGTTLYTTRDLAYHQDKFRRADRAVNILGEDHKLTMQQLGIALELIGVDHEPEVVWISFVSLPEGKMSTRRGRVVYLDDLMDEAEERAYQEVKARRGDELTEDEMRAIARVVGLGAVRFNISRVQPEKGITFRWEDALNFEGSSAPFVQYSHARCAGILDRADGDADAGDPGLLTHESEVALAKALARLPTVVAECASGLKVHPVAMYAIEVANRFNEFYRDCPVAQAEPPLRGARLALVQATKQVLANALRLLGVDAPDSM